MTDPRGTHSDRYSEQGGLKVQHPGSTHNRVATVHDPARPEFEKPDLDGDSVDQAAVQTDIGTFTIPSRWEIQP